MRAGWIGWLSGESQGKALERVVPEMNAAGYRVVFVLADQWNPFKRLFALVLLICTLGFWTITPNLLVIGEKVG